MYLFRSVDDARKVYCYLTPLRLLLRAENNPEIRKLDPNLEARKNTLLFCFNFMNVVRPMSKVVAYSPEEIQEACGLLDTNCYDLSWGKLKARSNHFIFLRNIEQSSNCVLSELFTQPSPGSTILVPPTAGSSLTQPGGCTWWPQEN